MISPMRDSEKVKLSFMGDFVYQKAGGLSLMQRKSLPGPFPMEQLERGLLFRCGR